MDKIDQAILEALQLNARSSLKEISAQVGLSLPATGERLRKLEKAGIVKGYTTILDAEKLGLEFCCFCLLILQRPDSHQNEAFLNFIAQSPEILECHCITGTYEFLLKIVTRSPKTLEEMLARLRDSWGVVKSSTYTVLSTIKSQPSVGPEAGH